MTLDRTRILPLFCLAILAVHWLNQCLGTYGLMFDEAQYWFWAKHPAWGYYSKPPMIGWLIAASTALFGDGNFGVKMLAPVILLLTGGTLYATARRLNYSPRIAAWVMATYITLPVVTGNSVFFTTDVPLQLFWAIALYAVVTALRANKPEYWLLAGAAAGFGLLSKYTMIAFAASCLVALLLVPGGKAHLRSRWPWLGALIAAALLAPNLLWNAHHAFVTFTHTNDNVFSKEIEIYPEDMLGFMAAQLGIFGPILLVALLIGARTLKRSDKTALLLHCFVWPLAIAGMIVSLLAGAQAHWIAPVYLAGTLLVVPWLDKHKPVLLRVSLGLHLVVLVLFYAAPTVVHAVHLKHDPFVRVFVWNDLATEVAPLVKAYPYAVLMTNERKVAAALTYQLRDLRGHETPIYKWKDGAVRDHYDLLTEQQDLRFEPLLVIMRDAGMDHVVPRRDARLLRRISVDKYRFSIYLLPPGGRIGYEPS